MNASIKILIVILLVCIATTSYGQSPKAKPGELIVQLRKNRTFVNPTALDGNPDIINFKLTPKKQLSKRLNIWVFEFDKFFKGDFVLEAVKRFPEIKMAQLNHFVEQRATVPNDSFFATQWNMNNDGSGGGNVDADIDAVEAWDISTGGLSPLGDTIVVAVIDDGFALWNSDLNYWKNRNEIPSNGIDDDGNSYKDDFDGWNVFTNSGTIPGADHGTHISGIIGAIGNNGNGIAGINWNVRILPVVGGSTLESDVIAAYSYVYEVRARYNETNGSEGAFVVATNSSFGVNFGKVVDFPIWCSLYDSFGTLGILNAGSAPNLGIDVDTQGDIPTTCPSNFLIGVTSTTNKDTMDLSVGYGDVNIDMGAPGRKILSTVTSDTTAFMSGTSMAAPHVAGAIALMFSAASVEMMQDYNNDPQNIALIMKNYLLQGVDTLSTLQGLTVTGGRLNLHKCLMKVGGYNGVGEMDKLGSGFTLIAKVYPNPTSSEVHVDYFLEHGGKVEFEIQNILGQMVYHNGYGYRSAGMHRNTMDISSLDGGFYLMRIKSKGTIASSIKLFVR